MTVMVIEGGVVLLAMHSFDCEGAGGTMQCMKQLCGDNVAEECEELCDRLKQSWTSRLMSQTLTVRSQNRLGHEKWNKQE